MTELEFILKHGNLMIEFAIKPVLLGRCLDIDDEMGDLSEAYEALDLVVEMAYRVGRKESHIDIEKFIKI